MAKLVAKVVGELNNNHFEEMIGDRKVEDQLETSKPKPCPTIWEISLMTCSLIRWTSKESNKILIHEWYEDDIDLAQRYTGKMIQFFPLAGCMVSKEEDHTNSEADTERDKLTMRELKKVADNLMENIVTEYDCPSIH